MQTPASNRVPSPARAPSEPVPDEGGRMRIAYLTTEYPKVSHTFIRREILELERRGHEVARLAIRRGDAVDPTDLEEAKRTVPILARGAIRLVLGALGTALTRPLAFANALRITLRMSARSDRGLVRHAAYLVEACTVLRLTRERGIRHVHVHFGTNAAAVARLWRRLGGGSYSMTVHGPDEFDACVALSLGEKVAESEFTAAISSFGSAQLRRWTPYDCWSKIRIVRCTVGDGFEGEPTPIPAGSRTLVSVGRLSAQKGQLLLIDALAELVRAGIDARLVLVGDGEMRSEVEWRIAAAQLGDRVRITGWVDEEGVRAELRAARALVLPSFTEGLPVVIMEAFAAARPTISTFVAGIPELVIPGENGWLVPAGDVPSLVTAMREVLESPTEHLDEMGRAGRRTVMDRHRTSFEVDVLEACLRNGASSGEGE